MKLQPYSAGPMHGCREDCPDRGDRRSISSNQPSSLLLHTLPQGIRNEEIDVRHRFRLQRWLPPDFHRYLNEQVPIRFTCRQGGVATQLVPPRARLRDCRRLSQITAPTSRFSMVSPSFWTPEPALVVINQEATVSSIQKRSHQSSVTTAKSSTSIVCSATIRLCSQRVVGTSPDITSSSLCPWCSPISSQSSAFGFDVSFFGPR